MNRTSSSKFRYVFCFLMSFGFVVFGQQGRSDQEIVAAFFDLALTEQESYKQLDYLCNEIGARLSGSDASIRALDWSAKLMESYGADRVYKQHCKVPHWERGPAEEAMILLEDQVLHLNALANGGSVATAKGGVTAQVVEIDGMESMASLRKEDVEGKILFINGKYDHTHISTGAGYGHRVGQRVRGTSEAAKLGAVACVIRSVSSADDDHPHTGVMIYQDGVPKIPSMALGVQSADRLSAALVRDPDLLLFMKINSKWFPDADSYNVVGELRGSEFPDEIITVGGHMDSWDIAQGAHDDGAGCMHATGVLYLFKKLGISPKRTIRFVMFINEENGLRGGKKYAELAKENEEKHLVAIESDAGGFSPRGFGATVDSVQLTKLRSWLPLFNPRTISFIAKGGGGADINPLHKLLGTPTIGLITDGQRNFDVHHAPIDNFDMVHPRELELGTASLAALIYLIDKYGL